MLTMFAYDNCIDFCIDYCSVIAFSHRPFGLVFSAESPLQFYVNHASCPSVTAYGPGLSYGVANKTATFTVFTDDASEGAQNTK